MVPRARTTQRWSLRPWRSQRKMYVVIYRGALRRRMRRPILRDFNNVGTTTRNGDLAIRAPNLIPRPSYVHRRFLAYGGNMAAFSASAGTARGLFVSSLDCGHR